MNRFLLALVALPLALSSKPARAEGTADASGPAAAVEVASEPFKANSVNYDLSALVLKGFAANYEHLFKGGHGVLVEGVFRLGKEDGTSKTAMSGGLSLGYRYHFTGEQSSWFAGPLLTASFGSGEGSVTGNDNVTKKTFPVSYASIAATANVGRRWVIASTVNITGRIGAGYTKRFYSTDSSDPDAQAAAALVDALLSFIPVTIDGELSLGLIF